MMHKVTILLMGVIFYLCGFISTASAMQQWYSPPVAKPVQTRENYATFYFLGYKVECLKSNTFSEPQKVLIAEEIQRALHKFSTRLTSNEQKTYIEAAQSIILYAPESQKHSTEKWLIKRMDTRTTPALSVDKRLAIASFLVEFGTEQSKPYIRYTLKNLDILILKNYRNQALNELSTQDLLNWSRMIAAKVQ